MPLPEVPDVWAPVGTSDLPADLVAAASRGGWADVRQALRGVMDGAITDGVFGRELLQFVLELPPGVDAVFDRYRAAAMLDHGDWDGLRGNGTGAVAEPYEVRRVREILTAPIDRVELPPSDGLHQRALFEIYEYQARRTPALMRRWAQRISGVFPQALWERDDVAVGRHLRYRQLHDVMLLGIAEAQGGRLHVAYGLSREATRLGDESEAFRYVAHDLAELVRLAMGDRVEFELETFHRICQRTGPSPVGTWEMLFYLMPFLPLRNDESVSWAARLGGYIAARLASPRWQLQADSWRVMSEISSAPPARTEIAALVARARKATPGLRCLPTFLSAVAQRRYEVFEEAERYARQSGNVWLQISALTWMTAIDPRQRSAHQLRRLLDITGWRRPVLVPTEVAADAALGMTTLGERSESVLEMALTADRPNVTTAVVSRYIDDVATPMSARLAAVDALGRVGTTHAREILSRLSQRRDEIGKAAARTVQRPALGLSEREIEVLSLAADGLTNKQIAEKLFLSPHTIARHLANAREKLGASNRAEAAVRLHRAGVD